MKYMLDANTVIQLLTNEYPRLTLRVAGCDAGSLVVSVIAFAEVALGSGRGKPPPIDALEGFIEEVAILPFEEAAARTYAKLPFKRGSYDRLIAAHAIATDLVLVSSNLDNFAKVPGLKLEDWTQ